MGGSSFFSPIEKTEKLKREVTGYGLCPFQTGGEDNRIAAAGKAINFGHYFGAQPSREDSNLDTVSTAGGTDCVQVNNLIFDEKLICREKTRAQEREGFGNASGWNCAVTKQQSGAR